MITRRSFVGAAAVMALSVSGLSLAGCAGEASESDGGSIGTTEPAGNIYGFQAEYQGMEIKVPAFASTAVWEPDYEASDGMSVTWVEAEGEGTAVLSDPAFVLGLFSGAAAGEDAEAAVSEMVGASVEQAVTSWSEAGLPMEQHTSQAGIAGWKGVAPWDESLAASVNLDGRSGEIIGAFIADDGTVSVAVCGTAELVEEVLESAGTSDPVTVMADLERMVGEETTETEEITTLEG